ncbi:unnamed protein product [Chondrus crispus]|uniref:Uncharacterized protein n=1 Tax=Chondrus crispus TaxID=2769 RepID=R7QA26_CHOCR|nr:unnamed protein product [Chondrus crispus]CDF34266.1 unnamed protein product [Chondrus crispus]|eukprot:XP_005714085.1 unnamed protein product [Chondrus crispus]
MQRRHGTKSSQRHFYHSLNALVEWQLQCKLLRSGPIDQVSESRSQLLTAPTRPDYDILAFQNPNGVSSTGGNSSTGGTTTGLADISGVTPLGMGNGEREGNPGTVDGTEGPPGISDGCGVTSPGMGNGEREGNPGTVDGNEGPPGMSDGCILSIIIMLGIGVIINGSSVIVGGIGAVVMGPVGPIGIVGTGVIVMIMGPGAMDLLGIIVFIGFMGLGRRVLSGILLSQHLMPRRPVLDLQRDTLQPKRRARLQLRRMRPKKRLFATHLHGQDLMNVREAVEAWSASTDREQAVQTRRAIKKKSLDVIVAS